jgi:ectoine hydroxylase-related dioxygenase (phytanoyl-CoA dioxygenase family)
MTSTSTLHQRELVENGYTILRSAVPTSLTDNALALINQALGEVMVSPAVDAADAQSLKDGQQLKHLSNSQTITALANESGLVARVADIVGAPLHRAWGGQIALRFPGHACAKTPPPFSPQPWWDHGWHIDGLPGHTKELQPGRIGHFTLLCGVCIEPVTEDFSGNLIVFPSSHLLINRHLNQGDNLARLAQDGDRALPKDLPLSEPVQVKLSRGDVVLAHHQLAHSIAPNSSPRTRYMVYFRLNVVAHQGSAYRPAAMLAMWSDWGPAVQALAAVPFRPASADADEEVATLRELGKTLHDSHDWEAAAQVYERLSVLRPRNWEFAFRAGSALTWASAGSGHGPADRAAVASRGTPFLERAWGISPGLAWVGSVLVRNLAFQGRHAEVFSVATSRVLHAAEKSVEEPWKQHLVREAAKAMAEALTATGRPADIPFYASQFEAAFPSVFAPAQPAMATPQAPADLTPLAPAELWQYGLPLLRAEPKTAASWARARPIFSRLAVIDPTNFWSPMCAAMCFALDPQCPSAADSGRIAAEHCRSAVALDPSSPLPHALLAKALLQSKAETLFVVQALNEVIARPGRDALLYSARHEHLWLLLIALRVAKSVLSEPEQREYFAKFVSVFPNTASEARRLAQEPTPMCVIS